MAVVRSASYVVVVAVIIAAILSVSQAQAPDQATYLAAHNAARSELNVGMVPLVWNVAAYSVAAAWAAGCVYGHNPNADSYGENIAMGTGLTATEAMDMWLSEKANYDYATGTCSGVCGHYTQIVWNTTTSVGCASADCGTDGIFHVCDYSPPGNVGDDRPY
jgi:pathogenesis-related protein 1